MRIATIQRSGNHTRNICLLFEAFSEFRCETVCMSGRSSWRWVSQSKFTSLLAKTVSMQSIQVLGKINWKYHVSFCAFSDCFAHQTMPKSFNVKREHTHAKILYVFVLSWCSMFCVKFGTLLQETTKAAIFASRLKLSFKGCYIGCYS